MALDRKLINIILLGLAFMLVFTAFQTMGNIQKTFISSIHDEDKNFNVEGYITLAIIYAVFSVFQWAVPSVISVFGANCAMTFGGITYLFFISTFMWPQTWLMYTACVVLGVGAALIWTGQGNYLALNSTPATISRNSGIFWALLQLSMFIGNTFVFFQFKGLDKIDKDKRSIVIWVLSAIAVVGIVFLIVLPRPRRNDDMVAVPSLTPLEALKGAGKLCITKEMLLITITSIYTGLELGFFSGVYSSAIGFTTRFASPKELIGLSGIFIGVGEVLGGAAFGLLGSKTTKLGRDPVVIAGFIIHALAFFMIFLNLPNSSPFGDTDEEAFIKSNAVLAIFCSFLLGLGDACFNTQMFSLLGGVYADNSTSAFAIFKFSQSVASAISFAYASKVVLYGQLGILLVSAVLGTLSFVWVEWSFKKQASQMTRNDSTSSSETE